jgi:hypothetical protein
MKNARRSLLHERLAKAAACFFDEQIERLSEVAHRPVPDVGRVTYACSEIPQQQPRRELAPSPWWRLARFFR